MGYSRAQGTLIYEKNLKAKISCQTPFKYLSKIRNDAVSYYCGVQWTFFIVVEVITVAYDDRLRLFDTSKLSGVLSSKER